MASKASKLQSGAKKTAFGLFDGMPKLDEKAKNDNKEVKASTEVKKTEETKAVKEPEKATVEIKEEPVKESVSQQNEQQPVYGDQAALQPEKEPAENVQPVTKAEPVQEILPQETLRQEPQQLQQTPIINQPQVQLNQQPPLQTYIPQPQIQQPQQPQVYRQPSYNAYQQPMNTMAQMPYMQQMQNAQYNEPRRATRAEKGEKNSRYEKEKFLLLDIRGLRDYVEHMAKASNMSATKYIRSLIEKDWAANNDIYMAHKALEEQLRQKNNLG